MAHAWLDSLSEDWVSQPGDNSSDKLPPLTNNSNSNTLSTPVRKPDLNCKPDNTFVAFIPDT